MNLENFKLCYPRAITCSDTCAAVIEKLERRGVNRNDLNRIYNALHCPCWAVLDRMNELQVATDKEPTYVLEGLTVVKVAECRENNNTVTLHDYDGNTYDIFHGIDAVNFALATFGPLLLFTDG